MRSPHARAAARLLSRRLHVHILQMRVWSEGLVILDEASYWGRCGVSRPRTTGAMSGGLKLQCTAIATFSIFFIKYYRKENILLYARTRMHNNETRLYYFAEVYVSAQHISLPFEKKRGLLIIHCIPYRHNLQLFHLTFQRLSVSKLVKISSVPRTAYSDVLATWIGQPFFYIAFACCVNVLWWVCTRAAPKENPNPNPNSHDHCLVSNKWKCRTFAHTHLCN